MKLSKIVKKSQEQLFSILTSNFGKKAIAKEGSYILVKGAAPILLVAHLDTVHKEGVREVCIDVEHRVMMSPQGIGGDDRCGVYGLLKVYNESPVYPWLLFTCDEEVGCIGARDFTRDYVNGLLPECSGLSQVKFIVEIDRQGEKDAVYYDCANEDFEDFVTSYGFVTTPGLYSDISEIAPTLGIAAVNLSSGYYKANTTSEYIMLDHLEWTIERVKEMVIASCRKEVGHFEYIDSMDRCFGYGSWDLGGSTLQSRQYNLLTEDQQIMYEELVETIGEYDAYLLLKEDGAAGIEDGYMTYVDDMQIKSEIDELQLKENVNYFDDWAEYPTF